MVAEGLGKMLMHDYVWAETGLGDLEQGDTVKVRVSAESANCAAHAGRVCGHHR